MSAASALKIVPTAAIGESVVIKGQIVSHEDLIIRGEIEGTIEIPEHSLTIASEGKVRADVNVRELEVIGSIHGNIEAAEKVYLRNGSNVVGDIQSAGILIEDGAQIKGGIDLTRRSVDRPSRAVETNSNIRELSHAVSTA